MKIEQPYKNLIRPLTTDEYEQLEQSILADGCRDPLVLWNDKLLDGHNRYEICDKHNIQFETAEIDLHDENAAKIWILQNQLARRNLTTYERAEIALQLEPLIAAKAKEQQGTRTDLLENSTKSDPINTRLELAQKAGISDNTIARAKLIHEKGTEEQKERLRKGDSTINREYTAIRKQEQQKRNAELQSSDPPVGKYDVIVVDPPWPMKKIERDCTPEQAGFDYPTMELVEMSEMCIPAADDCHLFLWTTHKFLPAAFRLIDEWGFRYVFTMTWHKPGGFQPFGLAQYNSEFILYARHGTPKFVDTKAFNTCFNAPRSKHSEKPQEFYDTIKRVTSGKRLDMFSRREIDGFDSWGNET
jgi:N6-adenosine-specific RNA methylase IME4/ParB-like chromosome segregation protein Spo0J